jgi:60S ribosome subunit biogenesis protein NIP7
MRKATSVGRDQLISLGICFGKFTKTGKFRMHVTCLDYIAQYAKVKTSDCFAPYIDFCHYAML